MRVDVMSPPHMCRFSIELLSQIQTSNSIHRILHAFLEKTLTQLDDCLRDGMVEGWVEEDGVEQHLPQKGNAFVASLDTRRERKLNHPIQHGTVYSSSAVSTKVHQHPTIRDA
ncbi:hypothetical protein BLNAU_9118 [Blattamonas nauphoetae]|uniref:Transposase n=1 Tax=Blattamonas nauphoetae TaxID=2049346 RepID=A0ABQ9XWV4_9EUKA|nr:hypothetical protein BLNAU_9118 [Blattamonas nauphoetae]